MQTTTLKDHAGNALGAVSWDGATWANADKTQITLNLYAPLCGIAGRSFTIGSDDTGGAFDTAQFFADVKASGAPIADFAG